MNIEHPDPPEITIRIEQHCPACGQPFHFKVDEQENAFTVDDNIAVIVLECPTPDCRYTHSCHILLEQASEFKDEKSES